MADVRERLFIRTALEAEIAAEAARRMTRADKQALATNLHEIESAAAADDKESFYALDVAFHQNLTSRLGMVRAAEILDGLRVHLERVRRLMMSPGGRMRETCTEHASIAEAIEACDPAAAREAMTRHLGATSAMLETFSRERPMLFSP